MNNINKVKAILLKSKGLLEEIFELSSENIFKDIYKYFGVEGFSNINYHTFGKGYTAIWKCEQSDNTCMEITKYAGASFLIFINSRVFIINEDRIAEKPIEVQIDEVKQYFNTENDFWALVKV
jgi:hypothetical protein